MHQPSHQPSHKSRLIIACVFSIACSSSGAPEGSGGNGSHNGTGGSPTNPINAGGANASAGTNGNGGDNASMQGSSGQPANGSGTGGMSNTSNTGGAGGSSSNGVSNPLDMGKYFQSGTWMGYVWTSTSGAGSTIAPMDFSAQTGGMPRCVKGTVAAADDYGGTAILGFNLSEGNGATSSTVTPAKDGVLLELGNTGGSPLRFQVKSAASGGTEWCTPVSGSGGFIPWTSLRTHCWDDSGTAYNREPIAAAMLLVPGTNNAPVSFDFCVNGLAEADASSGGSGGMGAAGAGTSGTGGGGTGGTGTSGTGGPTVPPLQNGCNGFATRYWDCCKPHCGWSANAPSGALAACDQADNALGNADAANSCTGGPAYLCQSNAPWAVSATLSYGFAAVAALGGSDICGKCYQLDFTGSSQAGSDPGSAALAGKSMIVQAINIGGDVGSGQFDIAIPGGGVGAFNACSTQWGVSSSQLGATYGGFLATCKQQVGASDHQAIKNCVMQKCTGIFEQKGLTDLDAGCSWFVDWFQAADNPTLKYAEVACPNDLMAHGIHRNGGGNGACLP